MRVVLLPSNSTKDSELQYLTTFLVNDRVAIDGGSIGLALRPEEMSQIRHVVITHTHSDHLATLPVFVAEVFTLLDGPVTIYGLPETIASLKEFVFNDRMWPDFQKIPLPDGSGPTIVFETIRVGAEASVGGLKIRPVPVNHIVPCVGLVVRDGDESVVFTSDTYRTREIWQAAKSAQGLRAVFVDVSFPNELEGLAEASKHYTPRSLALDLKTARVNAEIYAVHIKPTNRAQVIQELAVLNNPPVHVAKIGKVYEW
ncbi:MAG TPA: 3',5'-cyclic-nucleotide phosphodiesterase [Blastocatellia bacterium]|nr:3',5'-cyclic-nucleotide phosphodiesterase [Blastocatellia bacterium]